MDLRTIGAIFAVVFFVAFLMFIGWYSTKYIKTSSDFLLAGREKGFGLHMMGLVTSGFAGTSLMLTPSFTLMFGLVGGLGFILAFTGVGVLLYGLFFSRTIRRSGAYTVAEWLEMRYGPTTRKVLALSALVGLIAITANNVLALSTVLTGYFGWSMYLSVSIGVITFLVFTYLSGLWGVTLTDFVQAVVALVGGPLLIIALLSTFGGVGNNVGFWQDFYGVNFLTEGLSGGRLPLMSLVWPSALTMFFALGINLVWGSQHYWQRVASCRNEKVSIKVHIWGAILLFGIHIILLSVGLFAGANFGEAFTVGGGAAPPAAAYGMTIVRFGYLTGVFLLVFAMTASLSTCSATLIAAVSLSVKDIYPKFINKNPNDRQLTRVSRLATIFVAVAAWILAFYPDGTVFLFAFATAWIAPAGYLLVLGILWRRCSPKAAAVGAICAITFQSIWAIMDLTGIQLFGAPIGSYIHISVLAIVCTVVPAVVFSFFTKPKYYGEAGWTLSERK